MGHPTFVAVSIQFPWPQIETWAPGQMRSQVSESRPGAPRFVVGLEALLNEEADEIDYAVGVAPLVVVPAEDLDAVSDHLGERSVHDRRERVALEVGADQQVLVVAQDAFELTF